MNYESLSIPIAYILDLIFGDPRWFPHPVKLIGKTVEIFEKFLRKIVGNKKIGGIVLAFLIISGTFYVTFLIVKLSAAFNFYFGVGISIFLIYLMIKNFCIKIGKI